MRKINYYVETYNFVSNPHATFLNEDGEAFAQFITEKAIRGTTPDDPYIYIELWSPNEKDYKTHLVALQIINHFNRAGCLKVEHRLRKHAGNKIAIVKAITDKGEKNHESKN